MSWPEIFVRTGRGSFLGRTSAPRSWGSPPPCTTIPNAQDVSLHGVVPYAGSRCTSGVVMKAYVGHHQQGDHRHRSSGRLVRPTARRVPTFTSLIPRVNTTASSTPEGMYSNNPVRNSRTRATVTAIAMLTTCQGAVGSNPASPTVLEQARGRFPLWETGLGYRLGWVTGETAARTVSTRLA